MSETNAKAVRATADEACNSFIGNPSNSNAKRAAGWVFDAIDVGAMDRAEAAVRFAAMAERIEAPAPFASFLATNPDAFARACEAEGYERASAASGEFVKRFGPHAVYIQRAPGNEVPSAYSWVVALYLNGKEFNRWSKANFPDVPCALRYAVAHIEAIEGVQAAFRPNPLAALDAAIRARLVDEMGFRAEMVGGGCTALVSYSSGGGSVMVTCYGGGGLPAHDDWQVGAYDREEPSESIFDVCREPGKAGQPLHLFEAVQAALSVIAEREAH